MAGASPALVRRRPFLGQGFLQRGDRLRQIERQGGVERTGGVAGRAGGRCGRRRLFSCGRLLGSCLLSGRFLCSSLLGSRFLSRHPLSSSLLSRHLLSRHLLSSSLLSSSLLSSSLLSSSLLSNRLLYSRLLYSRRKFKGRRLIGGNRRFKLKTLCLLSLDHGDLLALSRPNALLRLLDRSRLAARGAIDPSRRRWFDLHHRLFGRQRRGRVGRALEAEQRTLTRVERHDLRGILAVGRCQDFRFDRDSCRPASVIRRSSSGPALSARGA